MARLFFGIGPLYHSLYRLFGTPLSEWSSYVPEEQSHKITGRVTGKAGYELARNKSAFYRHCCEREIPTVPVLGEVKVSHQDNIEPVSRFLEFESLILSASPNLFFKISNGAHGDGAFRVSRAEGHFWSINDRVFSARELYEFFLNKVPPGQSYLIQPAILPHEELLKIMPKNALGTVRIITWLEGGEAKVLQPVLRIPANGNDTDNFSFGSLGNLIAPIDLQSGKLGIAKGSRRRDWPAIVDVVNHPDTGAKIEGRTMPLWRETVDLALDAQRKTPELPTAGWDIAITDDGPLIVEANTQYAVGIQQVAYRRGIRSELSSISDLAPYSIAKELQTNSVK